MIEPKGLTQLPGVYLFKNETQEVIYIGKAKNIAKRVSSYFAKDVVDPKISALLLEAVSIDTITTKTELEALYLEATLIKQYKPKFNVLLKDSNPFIFFHISNEAIPKISLVRTQTKKGSYIGPFLTSKVAKALLNFLIKRLQIKLCNKKIAQGCLEYHMNICAGICTNEFDEELYKTKIAFVQHLLKNDPKKTLLFLDEEIKAASKNLQFEKAQHLTEYKRNLEEISKTIQQLSHMSSKGPSTSQTQQLPLLMEIKKRLHLQHIPYVIDCFDISHLQGTGIVGSCIRYVHGVPDKKSFRHFAIKSLIDQNDYAALQEIVQRRYKNPLDLPNLIIVDGGKGQINAIKPFIKNTELVGLAKREETIITSDFKHFIKLDPQNPTDALLLQIRDYAHHFAITYQRKKRSLIS